MNTKVRAISYRPDYQSNRGPATETTVAMRPRLQFLELPNPLAHLGSADLRNIDTAF